MRSMLPHIATIKTRLEHLYRGSDTELSYLPFYLERIVTHESTEFQQRLAQSWALLQLDFELFLWTMQLQDYKDQLP